jgi:hypothetical protein
LEINFQNGVPLVEFWRLRKITDPEKESGQDTKRDNPNSLDHQMPEVAKIESVLWLDQLFVCMRQRRTGGVRETPINWFSEWLFDHEKVFTRAVLQMTGWFENRRIKKFSVKKYFRQQ